MQMKLSEIDMNAVRHIDAEAADILRSAVSVAKAILSRRHEMDTTQRASQPLYVLAGETHYNPCEYLHHILVMEAIKQGGTKLACGVEAEHDFYETDSFDPTPKKGSDKYLYNSFDFACDFYDGGGAAYSRKVLFSYLAGQKRSKAIAPIFNDAACNPFDELVLDDIYTRKALKSLSFKAKDAIFATDSAGIMVRNQVMLEMVSNAAHLRKLNVIFQVAGCYHLGGGGGADARASMSAILDQAQMAHFNIYSGAKPRGAYQPQYGEDIVCQAIGDYEASGKGSIKLILDEAKGEYIRLAEREKEFFDQKLEAIGLTQLKVK